MLSPLAETEDVVPRVWLGPGAPMMNLAKMTPVHQSIGGFISPSCRFKPLGGAPTEKDRIDGSDLILDFGTSHSPSRRRQA
jgi:hypothetical protein